MIMGDLDLLYDGFTRVKEHWGLHGTVRPIEEFYMAILLFVIYLYGSNPLIKWSTEFTVTS